MLGWSQHRPVGGGTASVCPPHFQLLFSRGQGGDKTEVYWIQGYASTNISKVIQDPLTTESSCHVLPGGVPHYSTV